MITFSWMNSIKVLLCSFASCWITTNHRNIHPSNHSFSLPIDIYLRCVSWKLIGFSFDGKASSFSHSWAKFNGKFTVLILLSVEFEPLPLLNDTHRIIAEGGKHECATNVFCGFTCLPPHHAMPMSAVLHLQMYNTSLTITPLCGMCMDD